jgi:phosphoribosyl isomerase A
MAFTVFPAIDIFGGRLTMMVDGRPSPVADFDGDPVAAAHRFTDEGARWLHVVDVGFALTGAPPDARVLGDIRRSFPRVRIQCSGGVRDRASVDRLLIAGADRVVLSSSALDQPDRVWKLVSDVGDRLVVGVEVADGRIWPRGEDGAELDLGATLDELVSGGAPSLLVTALDRVGGLGGPDLHLIRRVVSTGMPVVAAGGVRSTVDLRAVRDAGAVGAVVGRAAIEGGVSLASAIDELEG